MNNIVSVDSNFIRPSYTYDTSDNILSYSKVLSSRYLQENNGRSYNMPERAVHEGISRTLAEYLLEEGHITFKTNKDIMTGQVETIGTINIFDMNKFNKRYRPEYLI